MDHEPLSRRGLAALLGAGLAWPSLSRAAPHRPQLDPERTIIAAVRPSGPTPDVLEIGADPYRRITAPLSINGQGPFAFVVDTGANQSVIALELAQALGLPAGPSVSLHGVAAMETTATVMAREVQVGRRTETDVLMPALPRAAIGADGLLGVDHMAGQRLTLDLRSRQLTVERSRFEESSPHTSLVKARQRAGQLTIVDADLAGIRVSAFLDSGAERTIGNPALQRLAVLRLPASAIYEVPIISVTGRTLPGQIAMLPVLRLGHVHLVNITVTFADLHVFQIWGLNEPAILVGMDALSTFDRVTLDFGRGEVLFQLDPRKRPRRSP